jgi:ring-1,2-phenylacetyl-CoA epoxidase subunit PaaD
MAIESDIRQQVLDRLQQVTDPEINTVSIIEMGMVEKISGQPPKVTVELIPTYVGCPALDMIRRDVIESVRQVDGVEEVEVVFLKHPAWTSERITPEGREKMKEFGIAPPPKSGPGGTWTVECPYCASPKTVMQNLFGPTSCRSIFYCQSCKNPFEAIKPV